METKNLSSYPSSVSMAVNSSHLEPPPYSEAPPEYSALYMSHTSMSPESPVYMEHPITYPAYPPAPQEVYNHTQPSAPTENLQTSPPPVILINQINNQTVAGQASIPHNAPPHRTLLQATTTRIVNTIITGRRKTESFVADFETGKEYIIKERTSRRGLRNKTVIKEVGGPRTIVKETPRKTIIKQKKH